LRPLASSCLGVLYGGFVTSSRLTDASLFISSDQATSDDSQRELLGGFAG
jgi:hypothetical protein